MIKIQVVNHPMSENDVIEIKAAGGVLYRLKKGETEPEVLMIKRNGKWDIPKGKVENDESIQECAVREVSEETGSDKPDIVQSLGTTYHQYGQSGEKFGKTTYWYSMKVENEQVFTPQTEEGITQIKWMPISDAIAEAGYENLKELLHRFKISVIIDKN